MKYATFALIAGILALLALLAVELGHIEQLQRAADTRRYLDCVMSPAGGEMICKQVTATDPPYVP